MLRSLLRLLLILFLFGLLILLGIFCMVLWKQYHVPAPKNDFDAILVLGAQVTPEGRPSIQLQWRLDAAAEAYASRPCRIVVCGAQGSDEPDAEAHIMANTLIRMGIPAEQILQDDQSFNTRQNIRNAAELLAPYDIRTVLVVTSDFHLPRALRLAEDQGFVAEGLGSPTLGGYWWLKNHCRETLAWSKYWLEHYLKITL